MKVLTKYIGIWKLFFNSTPDGSTYLVAKLIFAFSGGRRDFATVTLLRPKKKH